jgi:hypothetical protein
MKKMMKKTVKKKTGRAFEMKIGEFHGSAPRILNLAGGLASAPEA